MGSAIGVVSSNKKLALVVLGGLLVFLGNSNVVRADKPQFANTDSVAGSRGSDAFAGSRIVSPDSFFAVKDSVNHSRINTSSIEETSSFGEIRSDAEHFKHFGFTGSPVISNSVFHFDKKGKHDGDGDGDDGNGNGNGNGKPGVKGDSPNDPDNLGSPEPTPEPGTWLLSLTGAIALGLMWRRRALV
jgi:hypothetical protein